MRNMVSPNGKGEVFYDAKLLGFCHLSRTHLAGICTCRTERHSRDDSRERCLTFDTSQPGAFSCSIPLKRQKASSGSGDTFPQATYRVCENKPYRGPAGTPDVRGWAIMKINVSTACAGCRDGGMGFCGGAMQGRRRSGSCQICACTCRVPPQIALVSPGGTARAQGSIQEPHKFSGLVPVCSHTGMSAPFCVLLQYRVHTKRRTVVAAFVDCSPAGW
jgi:hypothetical protein